MSEHCKHDTPISPRVPLLTLTFALLTHDLSSDGRSSGNVAYASKPGGSEESGRRSRHQNTLVR